MKDKDLKTAYLFTLNFGFDPGKGLKKIFTIVS